MKFNFVNCKNKEPYIRWDGSIRSKAVIEISMIVHRNVEEQNNYNAVVLWKIWTFDFPSTGDEGRSPSRKKLQSKRMSVILPAEVQLPSPGLEYTPHSPEQSDQLIDALSQSFYRQVSRYVLLRVCWLLWMRFFAAQQQIKMQRYDALGNRSVISCEERIW